MNQAGFLTALEQESRLRGIGFRRADLLEFVPGVWPRAQENPDVTFWAQEFLESGRGSVLA